MVKLANWQNEQNETVKLANRQNEQNEMVKLANWQNEQNEMVKLANLQNEQNEKCLCRFSHSAHSTLYTVDATKFVTAQIDATFREVRGKWRTDH